jgi:hypothetical protein
MGVVPIYVKNRARGLSPKLGVIFLLLIFIRVKIRIMVYEIRVSPRISN